MKQVPFLLFPEYTQIHCLLVIITWRVSIEISHHLCYLLSLQCSALDQSKEKTKAVCVKNTSVDKVFALAIFREL